MEDADSDDGKTEFIKRRKENSYIADNLDNRATTKEIVQCLQATHRKNKVATLYCQTVRQILRIYKEQTHHYIVPGHPLNTFSAEWDGDLRPGYFEEFSHKSLLPKMIAPLRNIHEIDPVTELMNKKLAWKETLSDHKKIITTISKKVPYKWVNDEVLYCPKQWITVAEHCEQNPDRYFNSSYNWYYAGNGNMHLVEIAGLDYILQSELKTLYILTFIKSDFIMDYNNIAAKYECQHDIFETVITRNTVALRTKNKIYILRIVISEDCSLNIEKQKEIDSNLPFTGISFDEYHKNILYVTTLDYKLTIVNLDRMTGRSKQLRGNVPSLVDNWSTVLGSERGYYTHVSKSALTLYDKRTNKAFQKWKNLRRLTSHQGCNDISVARHCTGKPFLYFGTDHHVFMMDMRYNKTNDDKIRAVQRWTHGMQCLPTYMTISDNFGYNKELICMTSQWCEDMCVVSNHTVRTQKEFDVRSVSMPYRPPSVMDALNAAKQKILCCNLRNPIEYRLSTCITGLSVVEDGETYHILMLNSLGDITSHALSPRYMTAFFEDTGPELLHEWSKGYVKEEKDLEVSKIKDISAFWKCLKRVPDDYKLGDNVMVRKAHKFDEKEIYEAFEKQEVEPGLLDIWTTDSKEHTVTKDESSLNLFFKDDDDDIDDDDKANLSD